LADRLPLWTVFLFSTGIVMLSIAIGRTIGLRKRESAESAAAKPIGSAVGAMLGLLAFLLAFTFAIASNRFDARKQLLLDEVNAIGTTYLRANLLPEPHRSECRNLLKEYVDTRVEMARNPRTLLRGMATAEELQDRLWSHAVALARADLDTDAGGLFVESLNEVIDLHTARKTVGLQYRIPPAVWLGVIIVTVLTTGAMGFQFGLSGQSRFMLSLILALAFSTVVLLIANLDRPGSAIRVNQQPMFELQRTMAAGNS
jgi:hypothetical protein